jgi:hypothetical protein
VAAKPLTDACSIRSSHGQADFRRPAGYRPIARAKGLGDRRRWRRYGSTVFFETIVAGIAGCF